jgi:hypothetical protein
LGEATKEGREMREERNGEMCAAMGLEKKRERRKNNLNRLID